MSNVIIDFFIENIKIFFLSLFFIIMFYYFAFGKNKYRSLRKEVKTKTKEIKTKTKENKTKTPNPIFNNNIIITKEYNCPSFFNKVVYYYEIYKLNNNKDSIYIALSTNSNSENYIKIIKMNISNKHITELTKFKVENFAKKIKYFNDTTQNKEYLFISFNKKIIIYLIKTEKKFTNILEYTQEGNMGGIAIYAGILPIHDFTIFFNKLDNTNYLIITFIYSSGCMSIKRKIKILKFDKNKLYPINEIKSTIRDKTFNTLFLLWEDFINKKIFLITNIYDKLKIINISFNFENSFIYTNNRIDGFEQFLGDYGCIIYNNKKDDSLYIGDNKGILSIINLRNKQIIKQIKIKELDCIIFIDNWDDKYIIIGNIPYIYVYNININKIISKYYLGTICHIEKFFYKEFEFYSLCVGGRDKTIRLLY